MLKTIQMYTTEIPGIIFDPQTKRNFATHPDLSVETKDPETVEIMRGYMTDILRDITPDVTRKFDRKSRIETSNI